MGSTAAATLGVSESAAVGSPGGPQAPSARRLTASTEEAAGRATEGGGWDGIRKRGYPVRGPGAEHELPAAPEALAGCDARLVAVCRRKLLADFLPQLEAAVAFLPDDMLW